MIIYKITNRVNDKIYIGKFVGSEPQTRWEVHCADARRGSALYFHQAIRKYGSKAFLVEVLYLAETPEELNLMETFFIVLHQSNLRENGYNLTLGGDGFRGHHTEETKRKISRPGEKNPAYGKVYMTAKAVAARKKHAERLAVGPSEETRKRLSQAQKARWARMGA